MAYEALILDTYGVGLCLCLFCDGHKACYDSTAHTGAVWVHVEVQATEKSRNDVPWVLLLRKTRFLGF